MTKTFCTLFYTISLFAVAPLFSFASPQIQRHQQAMTVSHLVSEHNAHGGHNGTVPSLETLIVSVPVSAEKLAEVKTHFKTVHVFAEDETVTKEAAREAEVWYCNWFGIPKEIEYEDVPNLKLVQLTSGKTLSSSIPFLLVYFPCIFFGNNGAEFYSCN